jgi:hypothetical protein
VEQRMNNRNAHANALLDRMIAEKNAEEAREPAPSKAALEKELDWLAGWSKGKPIKRTPGTNFYGLSRTRNTILRPNMVKAILASDRVQGDAQSFTVKK